MGYMVHHALIVTGSPREDYTPADRHSIEDAHRFAVVTAQRLQACEVTELTALSTNHYRSFMVAPDGSKEGWATSTDGDVTRSEIIEWLRASNGFFSWAEVQYGDDGGDNRLTSHDSNDHSPLEASVSTPSQMGGA
jgi:hypothetical protein